MSIIVEALKKAQGSLKTTLSSRSGNTLPTPRPVRPEIQKPKIKKHIGIWVFASLLLLVGSAFYFLNPHLIKETLPAPPLTDNFAALKEEPVALKEEPTALKEQAETSLYVTRQAVEESPSAPFSAPVLAPVLAPAPAPVQAPLSPASPLTLAIVSKSIDLDGIMYTPEKPLAIINGDVWGEGDYIGKLKISKIEKDSVKVTSEGQEFIIRLKR